MIHSASAWKGSDLSESSWKFKLSSDVILELEEISVALLEVDECVRSDHLDLDKIWQTIGSFRSGGKLSRTIALVEERLTPHLLSGLGFCILTGLPVPEWGYHKSAVAFIVISKLMGELRQQNAKGHILGHVVDLGLSSSDPNVRVYQTHERQTFHTDSCDVVALLCLQPAREGGISSVVSSETIYNEMIQSHPDLLQELLKPVPTDRRGNI